MSDIPPDHPEHTCGRCGGRNVVWSVDSDRYNTAVNRSEIVCPTCFVLAHEEATGMTCMWQLTPATPFRWIEADARPTPFLADALGADISEPVEDAVARGAVRFDPRRMTP